MQPNKLLKFIVLVLLLSSLTLFSGCGGSVTPDNQPNEIIIEQTFESQSGIEFDTGVGLKVSVPPSLTENQMKLVVKYNSNPTQPQNDSSDFLNLHSSYSISITPQEKSLGQKLFQRRENRDQEPSNATLIFKIPQGVDSHNAVILEWTDEGWILAENEVGTPGGEVDGEDIYIVPGHLSEFAIGEWLYNAVFSALKKIPEPPPPTPIIDIQEPIFDDQNNLVMEINLDSPYGITLNLPKIGSLGLAGMWYCIEVESDNDINVDINGGKYLPPGIKRDITITFPPTGGDASICLQTGWCPLPRAAWNWVSRLGLPTEELEYISNLITSTELLLENYELYPNGVWNLEGVVWLVKKLLLQSFWKLTGSKIKFLANVVPVSIDITTYITASWFDYRPDICVEVSPSLPSENIILSYITVSPSTMSLVEGDSQAIDSITAHYSDGSNAPIELDSAEYTSNHSNIATVNSSGEITGISEGTAIITVRYTEGNITKTDTIEVTITSVTPETYTITASAGPHGSINPSGEVTINQGSDKSFTITPNAGYSIADVLVDGSSVGAVSSYTFINVTEDHTISATFISVAPGFVHNLTKDTYYNTIQAALDDADNNNTIEVSDGTYDETITFPFIKKIILRSINGASSTIIRGNDGSATVISESPREGTTLEGFTITHISGNKGRGIYTNGNLTIKNCIISGNSASGNGGGIYNYKGSITITGSTISGNSNSWGGGGIYNYEGSITITGSTISGNSANDSGGGIENRYYASTTITGSTISGNSAGGSGGGIANAWWSGSLTITGSTISGNSAGGSGGGIANDGDSLTITGSTISGNSTDRRGGGIYLDLYCLDITIGGSSDAEKNTICGNYKSGEVFSLDQQIVDYSGRSLYETYKDTNHISVYCD